MPPSSGIGSSREAPESLRLAILGNSGSGKTTLAHALAAHASLPVLDLDTVAWVPGEIAVSRDAETAGADVREFCSAHEGWIVEGCYAGLVGVALEMGARLVFLEPGVEACLAHCRARPFEPHKYASPEEQDARLAFLLDWVRDYYVRDGDLSLREHRVLFDRHSGPKLLIDTALPVADLVRRVTALDE
ncbi:MAG: shikimate kinase [Planctomycetota bacterium]